MRDLVNGVDWKAILSYRLLVIMVVLTGQLPVHGQEPAQVEFHHDFRNQALPPELKLFNDPDGVFCRFEPEGLRITVPKTAIHPFGGVGVFAPIRLHGDFELTAAIEMIDVERPPSGSGAGVALSLPTVSGAETAFIGRLVDIKGRQIIMCSEQSGPKWQSHPKPCGESLLRLRLKRSGTTLVYEYAPGREGDTFQELQRSEFNDDDIKLVRFTAVNNRTPCAMDVRLLDLRLRNIAPAGQTAPATASPPQPRHLLVTVVVIGLCLGLFAATWLYRRRGENMASREG